MLLDCARPSRTESRKTPAEQDRGLPDNGLAELMHCLACIDQVHSALTTNRLSSSNQL